MKTKLILAKLYFGLQTEDCTGMAGLAVLLVFVQNHTN